MAALPRIRHPARAVQALASRPPIGRTRSCVACGHRLGRFLPVPGGSAASPALMVALEVIGSDVDNYECPWCGCSDRDRHLLLYLRALELEPRFAGAVVAHFAPERAMAAFIRAQDPAQYLRLDLARDRPIDLQVNMERLGLASASVDIVLANHVLEHIPDIQSALAELFRILKPGGLAILQTPFSPVLQETFCDPGIIGARARTEAYGQDDHVRLFGSDIFSMICAAGFTSRVAQHAALLPDVDPERHGVNRHEPLFLFEKPAQPEAPATRYDSSPAT